MTTTQTEAPEHRVGHWFECPVCIAARDEARTARAAWDKACTWGGAGRGSAAYRQAYTETQRGGRRLFELQQAHR